METRPAPPPSASPAPRSFFFEWLKVLAFALLGALAIRSFAVEAFRIPTASMEQTLRVGDYVLVSKLQYGPRLPITIGIPFTEYYLPNVELAPIRLPGFSEVKQGDVIVFNYPDEHGPIDRKTHYIKRVIGLPGDSLIIRDKVPIAGGQVFPAQATMQQKWLATKKQDHAFPMSELTESGVQQITSLEHEHQRVAFEATETLASTIRSWEAMASVEPFVLPFDPSYGLRLFPARHSFSRDNYGPLYIPAKGDTLFLTEDNWLVYQDIITRFEHHTARARPDSRFEIDDQLTNTYIVEQDYFFVMGDNRDSSSDSRVWGFVPTDHIVGKAQLVYFSRDIGSGALRTERFFQQVQ